MRRLVAFGIGGPLLLALGVGGCGTAPSPSSRQGSRTSAPAPSTSSTSPTASPGSTPTTSPPPITSTTTEVQSFNPWNAEGSVSSTVRVGGHQTGGSCTQSSAFDVGNPDAWRCTEPGGGFLDPCFAPPGQSGITQVACGSSPWSAYTVLALAQPLATSSWGTPADNRSYPWAMVLADGQQCGLIDGTGAEIDGTPFNFGCTVGYASYPETTTQPWTATYAAGSSGPSTTVRVSTAWS